jgi:enoyl-CoA hydratase/carnithine racemase
MGLFVGLTAAHVNAADALYLGMADFAIPSEKRDNTLQALKNASWTADTKLNHATLSDTLQQRIFAVGELDVGYLYENRELISKLMAGDNVVDVCAQFLAHKTDDSVLQRAQKTLANGCPLTAHIVWQQLQYGGSLTLAEAFRLELTLSVNCAIMGDFVEGIRALLIDKDRNPQWRHAGIAEVSAEDIDALFIAPWGEQPHPLADLGE